jgi:tetratricopeptide (TPR) repeat protein
MRAIHLFVLALLLPVAAAAQQQQRQPLPSAESDGARRYRACVALLRSKPEEAFETGMQWRDNGGGAPAAHCIALALVELKQYGEAATRLEKLAEEMSRSGSPLTADMLGQAGNAWLLADEPARADAVLSAALDRKPESADLLMDRARARAAQNQWKAVLADLDHALQVEPDRSDAYALRAAAYRRTGNMARAFEDADTAVSLDPEDAAALYERGMARKARGDLKGARADWVKVRQLEPNSLVAEAAGSALEELDVKKDPEPKAPAKR